MLRNGAVALNLSRHASGVGRVAPERTVIVLTPEPGGHGQRKLALVPNLLEPHHEVVIHADQAAPAGTGQFLMGKIRGLGGAPDFKTGQDGPCFYLYV